MNEAEKLKLSIEEQIKKFQKQKQKDKNGINKTIKDYEIKKKERLAPHERHLKTGKVIPVKGFGAPLPEKPRRENVPLEAPTQLESEQQLEELRGQLQGIGDEEFQQWIQSVEGMEEGPEKDAALGIIIDESIRRQTTGREESEAQERTQRISSIQQMSWNEKKSEQKKIEKKMEDMRATRDFFMERRISTTELDEAILKLGDINDILKEAIFVQGEASKSKRREYEDQLRNAGTIGALDRIDIEIERDRDLIQSDRTALKNQVEAAQRAISEAEQQREQERQRRREERRQRKEEQLNIFKNRANLALNERDSELLSYVKGDIDAAIVRNDIDALKGQSLLKDIAWEEKRKMPCPGGKHREPSAPEGSYLNNCHDEKIKHKDRKGELSAVDKQNNLKYLYEGMKDARDEQEFKKYKEAYIWMRENNEVLPYMGYFGVSGLYGGQLARPQVEEMITKREAEFEQGTQRRRQQARTAGERGAPPTIKKWTQEELDSIRGNKRRRLGYMVKALGWKRWDSRAGGLSTEEIYDILKEGRVATGDEAFTERQMKSWISLQKKAFTNALERATKPELEQLLVAAYKYGRVGEIAKIEERLGLRPGTQRGIAMVRNNLTGDLRPDRRGGINDFSVSKGNIEVKVGDSPPSSRTCLFQQARNRRGTLHSGASLTEAQKRDLWWKWAQRSRMEFYVRGNNIDVYMVDNQTGKTLVSGTNMYISTTSGKPECHYIDMGAWGVSAEVDHLGFGIPLLGMKFLQWMNKEFRKRPKGSRSRNYPHAVAQMNVKYHTVTDHSGRYVGGRGHGYAGTKKFKENCTGVHHGDVQTLDKVLRRGRG